MAARCRRSANVDPVPRAADRGAAVLVARQGQPAGSGSGLTCHEIGKRHEREPAATTAIMRLRTMWSVGVWQLDTWVSQRNVVELHEQESVVNGPGTPAKPARALDAQHAESYLRLRAGDELGEAISVAQVQATADDLATTAKRCVARVAALAGALAAVEAVPESVAVSVLHERCAALVLRGLLAASELDTG